SLRKPSCHCRWLSSAQLLWPRPCLRLYRPLRLILYPPIPVPRTLSAGVTTTR
ncbi:hypothetical protein SARC_14405, partial [Sphaeroforma arctica JP610]